VTDPLRCGRIAYTNDLPIYAAFDAGAIAFPGSLHEDVPARLNAMLLAGDLDLSPVSSFAYAQHSDVLALLPDLCIGARSEVISVVLVSSVPPALLDGEPIFVTKESASGFNLLRVLLERRYGVRPTYELDDEPLAHARSGSAALLIGDAAIDAALNLPEERVFDLGRLWHEWTGESTVFAVWATRRDILANRPDAVREAMGALDDARAWSLFHKAAVVELAQRRVPRPPGFYEGYYGKLNFTFDAAAQKGLAAFCRELLAIGAIAKMPPTHPESLSAVAR
jgi:chorismate dehydratase